MPTMLAFNRHRNRIETRKGNAKNSINFPLLLPQLNSLFTSLSRLSRIFGCVRIQRDENSFVNANCESHTNDPKIFSVTQTDAKFQSKEGEREKEIEREQREKKPCVSEWEPTFNGKITPLLWNAVAVLLCGCLSSTWWINSQFRWEKK